MFYRSSPRSRSMLPRFRPFRLPGCEVLSLVLAMAWVPGAALAQQQPCNEATLEQANQLYLNVENEEVMVLLEECILREQGGFSGEQLEQAYSLYGQAAINLELIERAKSAIRALLQRVPSYEPNPLFDPPAYRNLVDEVREEMSAQQPPIVIRTFDNQTLEVGSIFTVPDLNLSFADPNEDTLQFEASSSDESVATVAVADNRELRVTPVAPGFATVTVRAFDPSGGRADATFRITVTRGMANAAPAAARSFDAQTLTLNEGQPSTITIDRLERYFRDPDGDPLTYTALTSDATVAQVTISAEDGVRVIARSSGIATITVIAEDERGGQAEQTFTVTVQAPSVASASNRRSPLRWVLIGGGVAVAGTLAAVLLGGGGGGGDTTIPLPPARPTGGN